MVLRFACYGLVAALAFGCGERAQDSAVSRPGDAPSYEEVYAAAEQALAEAEARRNVWTPTEKLMAQSRQAFAQGRVDDAIELATEARLLAELAVEQAETEQDAWRSRVLSH
jgi:hypothetical protein